MGEISLTALLILISIYAIIPGTVSFIIGAGIFKKGNTKHQIAFSFDDGPNPEHTPRLLELLMKHHIKATFFVLGSKAEQHPELILRMHQEGHLIGIHNYKHRSNWTMTPWEVSRHMFKTADIVEGITGVRPTYYRPPWGLLNVFDLFKSKYNIVLWSLMVGDWNSRHGSEKIKERLQRGLKGGSIVLLHDSGDTLWADNDAPIHMIEALEDVLAGVQKAGYQCVRVDEIIESRQAPKVIVPRMMILPENKKYH